MQSPSLFVSFWYFIGLVKPPFIITQSKSILFWSPHVLRCWFVKLLCFVIFLISWPVGVGGVSSIVLNGEVLIWLFLTCNWNFQGDDCNWSINHEWWLSFFYGLVMTITLEYIVRFIIINHLLKQLFFFLKSQCDIHHPWFPSEKCIDCWFILSIV